VSVLAVMQARNEVGDIETMRATRTAEGIEVLAS
jgi:hypothetical protein